MEKERTRRGGGANSTRRRNKENCEEMSKTTMFQAVTRARLPEIKFNMWVWRNWQLGEGAHPKGWRSEFDKAQKQGELRRNEQDDYVSSGHAGAAAQNKI